MSRRFGNMILDFDGTLTDSRDDIAGAQLWALAQLGVTTVRREELYPHIGKTLPETFRLILPPELHDRIPDAVALYSEYYPPRSLVTTKLFPGVAETLARLYDGGVALAVASTKRGTGILRATDHFGITKYFDQLQGSDDLPFKPDPAIVLKILHDRGWRPEDTLIVGDTDLDIRAGKAARVATCAVTYGAQSAQDLVRAHPDFVIASFSELLGFAP